MTLELAELSQGGVLSRAQRLGRVGAGSLCEMHETHGLGIQDCSLASSWGLPEVVPALSQPLFRRGRVAGARTEVGRRRAQVCQCWDGYVRVPKSEDESRGAQGSHWPTGCWLGSCRRVRSGSMSPGGAL